MYLQIITTIYILSLLCTARHTGRGTGTAIMEAKLAQEPAAIKRTPPFQIFLDLRKTYDALDRGRCLEIHRGYGVGPRILGILRAYWERQ